MLTPFDVARVSRHPMVRSDIPEQGNAGGTVRLRKGRNSAFQGKNDCGGYLRNEPSCQLIIVAELNYTRVVLACCWRPLPSSFRGSPRSVEG